MSRGGWFFETPQWYREADESHLLWVADSSGMLSSGNTAANVLVVASTVAAAASFVLPAFEEDSFSLVALGVSTLCLGGAVCVKRWVMSYREPVMRLLRDNMQLAAADNGAGEQFRHRRVAVLQLHLQNIRPAPAA